MPFSYSLVSAILACLLWVVAPSPHFVTSAGGPDVFQNPFGLCRSAYGSLIARLLKDSLHGYWHAGRTGHGGPGRGGSGAAEVPRVGTERHHNPGLIHEELSPQRTAAHPASALARLALQLSELERHRTVSTSNAPVSFAHRKYLDATAQWHLRLASRLDPGDSSVYEILHLSLTSSAANPEVARFNAQKLARRTIEHAFSSGAGLSDLLTGAGAAINLLNGELEQGSELGAQTEEVLGYWRVLQECLRRYRVVRQQAEEDGWWSGISETRRREIGEYASMLEKISRMIQGRLMDLRISK